MRPWVPPSLEPLWAYVVSEECPLDIHTLVGRWLLSEQFTTALTSPCHWRGISSIGHWASPDWQLPIGPLS